MKHHPAAHHHNMQLVFLTPFSQLLEFRKKVNNLIPQGLKKNHMISYASETLLQGCVRHVLHTSHSR
jgi:ABC-type microcin C transport system duplicated ATPase subunit YejF